MGDGEAVDGVVTYSLVWEDFLAWTLRLPGSNTYVFRGQARDWPLRAGLERLLADTPRIVNDPTEFYWETHLDAFKRASRGKRGSAPEPKDSDEWWALGQHYGLKTPLLDWTRSPFVAAYFAYCEDLGGQDSGRRWVYALDETQIIQKLKPDRGEGAKPDVFKVAFVRPETDHNNRLTSQRALFTRFPPGSDVQRWVERNFQGGTTPVLTKIQVCGLERELALHQLDLMNINHATLFPDLDGASAYCNLKFSLDRHLIAGNRALPELTMNERVWPTDAQRPRSDT